VAANLSAAVPNLPSGPPVFFVTLLHIPMDFHDAILSTSRTIVASCSGEVDVKLSMIGCGV
jgi:hypothetical protein